MKHLPITTCSVLSSISIGGFYTIRYVLWLLAFFGKRNSQEHLWRWLMRQVFQQLSRESSLTHESTDSCHYT